MLDYDLLNSLEKKEIIQHLEYTRCKFISFDERNVISLPKKKTTRCKPIKYKKALTFVRGFVKTKFASIYRRTDVVAWHHHLTRRTTYLDEHLLDAILATLDANEEQWNSVGLHCSRAKWACKVRSLKKSGLLVKRSIDEDHQYRTWVDVLAEQAKPDIGVLYIFPTTECNFSCRYCFIEKNLEHAQHSRITDIKLAKHAIDVFLANATRKRKLTVIFYGGEPLLRPVFVMECIDYFYSRLVETGYQQDLIQIVINTNASLITDDFAAYLKNKEHVFLTISLDGQAADNDAMRVYTDGGGTFSSIERGISLARTHNIPFAISITVGTHNIENLENHVSWIVERFDVRNIGLNVMHLFENGENPGAVDPKLAIERILAVGKMLFQQKNILEENTFGRRWRRFNGSPHELFLKNCGGMGDQIVLSPDGKIGTCHALLGSQLDFVELASTEDNIAKHPIWKRWADYAPSRNQYCRDHFCLEIDLCGGSCPYETIVSKSKSICSPYKFCEYMKALTEMYIWEKFDIITDFLLSCSALGTPHSGNNLKIEGISCNQEVSYGSSD